jgi:SAM-dependent methyltransferase
MAVEGDVKQQVREFYDQVGWQEVGEGVYQNARYEDLRPVSREYIHRCHLRVKRHLKPPGKYMLDAGSGPIQYPEYLEYSKGYQYRVCADISILALQEARKRTGEHGLFVVSDIANLPFKPGVFDGVVSLHTIHHLPFAEHKKAYLELQRVMKAGSTGVVVNGWGWASPISRALTFFAGLLERVQNRVRRGRRRQEIPIEPTLDRQEAVQQATACQPTGTFVKKENPKWLLEEVGQDVPLTIWVWRTVNVKFLRTFCHDAWGGRFLLRIIYQLEEWFPHFLGKYGNYPLVVIAKSDKR